MRLSAPKLLPLAAALALGGCGTSGASAVGGGPVLGYAIGRGFSFGLEAGGARWQDTSSNDELPWHFNVGLSLRRSQASAADRDVFGYLAWEPLFRPGSTPIPLTLGVGGSPELGWKPVLGLWGGVPVPLFTRPCARDCLGASLVLGYRWAGVHELYFTPKLGLVSGVAYSVD